MIKFTNEVKTGIVVVASVLAAALFYVKTTDFTGAPYRVKAYFNYADGVKEDAIVKLCGIEVGRVEKIQFTYAPETKVELVLALKEKARVHQDAVAFIATTGLIGDAYIGLTPGTPEKPFLKAGDVLTSEDPVEMRRIWKKAEAITENLDKTLAQVRSLTENANGILNDNRMRINGIVANIEAMSVNFKDFSSDLKAHPWKLLMKGKE